MKVLRKKGKHAFETPNIYVIDLTKSNTWHVSLFPNQIIVTFRKPAQELVEKHQLALQGDMARVVAMQHITKSFIDSFCKEMENHKKPQ